MSKRRGRPRKLAWVQRIFESEAEREKWFKTVGCPEELESQGRQQTAIPVATRDAYGRATRPMKVDFGESWGDSSITQDTDDVLSLRNEAADNEHIKLSPAWQRYVDFMCLFAESLPTDRKDAVKRFALLSARSRYWEPAETVPAVLGTMADLRTRWERGEIWFRYKYTRQNWIIAVEEMPPGMPPDEPEDLDEGGEPSGHAEGLKWTFD